MPVRGICDSFIAHDDREKFLRGLTAFMFASSGQTQELSLAIKVSEVVAAAADVGMAADFVV
jgi:recombinational DNA repair ATPase RecF